MKSTADAISLSSLSGWSGKVENDSTLRPENRAATAKAERTGDSAAN